jgi:hypothetical protein
MFGLFKNKDAEEVASDINKIHNKIYKIAKENKDGTFSIDRKIIEKQLKPLKVEIKKKDTTLSMEAGKIVLDYIFKSKNKDLLKAGYVAISTYPEYYFNILSAGTGKKDKTVALIPNLNNDDGKAVKETLVNDYKFKDLYE